MLGEMLEEMFEEEPMIPEWFYNHESRITNIPRELSLLPLIRNNYNYEPQPRYRIVSRRITFPTESYDDVRMRESFNAIRNSLYSSIGSISNQTQEVTGPQSNQGSQDLLYRTHRLTPFTISFTRTMMQEWFSRLLPFRVRYSTHNHDTFPNDDGLMFHLHKKIEITGKKNKPIESTKNTECPITFQSIEYEKAYLTCGQCKYNFSKKAIMKHLESNQICPMCRADWQDYCCYINRDPPIPKMTDPTNIMSYVDEPEQKMKTRHNKKWYYGK